MTTAEIIKSRQARYREIGTAFKALNDELRKPTQMKFLLTSSANQIVTSGRDQPKLFPKGSGPESGVKMKAKAAIWTKRSQFDALHVKMMVEADKLAVIAKTGDAAAMRTQLKVLGEACEACHKPFREED